jgi:hypothetical protein
MRLASLVGYSSMSRREWLVIGQNPEWTTAPLSVQGYPPQPGEKTIISWMQVYPNSFATLGVPLLAGRDFGTQDNQVWRPRPPSALVGIINESMARRFFGNERPIGRRFDFGGPERGGDIQIVGVDKDVNNRKARSWPAATGTASSRARKKSPAR